MPDEMVSARRAVTHTVLSALVVTLLALGSAVVWSLPAVVVAAGGLALLLALQVEQTVRLTRRLRHQDQERRGLAERIEGVRREERLRLAAALRDGVLQDLAGLGYLLDAVGPDLPDDGTRDLLGRAGEVLRGDLVVLRELAHGEVPTPRTPPGTTRPPDLRAGGPAAVSLRGRDGARGPRPRRR